MNAGGLPEDQAACCVLASCELGSQMKHVAGDRRSSEGCQALAQELQGLSRVATIGLGAKGGKGEARWQVCVQLKGCAPFPCAFHVLLPALCSLCTKVGPDLLQRHGFADCHRELQQLKVAMCQW